MSRYESTGSAPLDAVLSGIEELDGRASSAEEQRVLQMRELVLAAADGKSANETLRILRKIKVASKIGRDAYTTERIALCREFINRFPDSHGIAPEQYFGYGDDVASGASGKIVYVPSVFADAAFTAFSDFAGGAEAHTVRNFEALCENIYNGVYEYGIVPVENSENGKLLHFFKLINRYDLKIAAVCDISSADENSSSSFALLRRNILFPPESGAADGFFEFFISLPDPVELSDILTAAELCRLSLVRVDCFPLSYREKEFTFCPVFGIGGAELETFLLYMSLDFPRYIPIGIYPQIIYKG